MHRHTSFYCQAPWNGYRHGNGNGKRNRKGNGMRNGTPYAFHELTHSFHAMQLHAVLSIDVMFNLGSRICEFF